MFDDLLHTLNSSISCQTYDLSWKHLYTYKYHFCQNQCNKHISLYQTLSTGFQYSDTESCTCEVTMEELGVQCDITSQVLLMQFAPRVWVSFGKPHFIYSHSPEGPVLVLYHSYCPLNYCSDKIINFTLNSTDNQCRFSKQGILCGACVTGYSLTLGGSQCAHCMYH